MKIYIIIILLIVANIVNAKCDEVYFTPSLDCEKNIIKHIDNAKYTIDIAVYSITNNAIYNALVKAKNRGVVICIITDKVQSKVKNAKYENLLDAGINVILNTKHKIEHNKFAIFDNKILETGSYNWTESASRYNSENCLFLDNNKNDALINKYIDRFDNLWETYNSYVPN